MTNLRGFETPDMEAGNNTARIYGASIVAVMIVAIGGIGYATGLWNSKLPPVATFHAVPNAVLPQTLPPAPPPPVEMGAVPTPVVPAPVVVVAPTQVVRHALPVKTARTHVRAPAVMPKAEIAPVVAAPVAITPPPAIAPDQMVPAQSTLDQAPPTTPVQPAPVQAAPIAPAQPAPVQAAPTTPPPQ